MQIGRHFYHSIASAEIKNYHWLPQKNGGIIGKPINFLCYKIIGLFISFESETALLFLCCALKVNY